MVYYCFTHIKGFQKRSWISMVGAHQKWRFDGSTSSMGEFHQKMGNCFWPWWHNYHCNYHQPDYLKYQTSYIWPIPHSKKNNHEKKNMNSLFVGPKKSRKDPASQYLWLPLVTSSFDPSPAIQTSPWSWHVSHEKYPILPSRCIGWSIFICQKNKYYVVSMGVLVLPMKPPLATENRQF